MTWAHTVLPVCGSSGALFWAPSPTEQPESACARAVRSRPPRLGGTPQVCAPRARPHSAPMPPPFCISWCSHTTRWVFSCRCHGASLCSAAFPRGDLSSCRALSGGPLLGKSLVPIPPPLSAPEHRSPDALPKPITAPRVLLSRPSTRLRAQNLVVTQQAFLEEIKKRQLWGGEKTFGLIFLASAQFAADNVVP